MKSDSRYAATVFGIQFSYGPDQAYRGLTPVDHCNSSWKRDFQGVGHSLSVLRRAQRWNRGLRCRPVLTTQQVAGVFTVHALSAAGPVWAH
jgi:hypothetical protein